MLLIHFVGGSGDVTPISGGSSDREFHLGATTSSTDADVTITEDYNVLNKPPLTDSILQSILDDTKSKIFKDSETIRSGNRPLNITDINTNKTKPVLKRLSSLNLTDHSVHDGDSRGSLTYTNHVFQSLLQQRYNDNSEKLQSKSSSFLYTSDNTNFNKYRNKSDNFKYDETKNVLGSDKWGSSKEKFLENNTTDNKTKNEEKSKKVESDESKLHAGAVIVKESFIEVPRMTRVSKSFHGKSSSNSNLNISGGVPRRASDSVPTLNKKYEDSVQNRIEKISKKKTEKSGDENVNPVVKSRFTTTLVDEAEHAATYENKLDKK